MSSNAILKDKLLDVLPIEGFTQVVRNDTRHCSNMKSTLIDHIWIKNLSKLVQVKKYDTSSDHDMILSVMKQNGTVGTNCAIKTRDFRHFVKSDFIMELLGTNWSVIYDLCDPTLIASKITQFLCEPLNKMAPIKL